MGKKLICFLIILVLILITATIYMIKKMGPDPEYWIRKADYDQAVKIRDQKIEASLVVIGQKDEIIAQAEKDLSSADQEIEELKSARTGLTLYGESLSKENEKLKSDVRAVIESNPKIKALIDNYDLRLSNDQAKIANRDQIIVKAFDEIAFQKSIIKAQEVQIQEWKGNFEMEQSLRFQSDALRIGLEDQVQSGKIWKKVGKVALVTAIVLGGIEIIQATGK